MCWYINTPGLLREGLPKFNLQQEFDDANQKYFDGKLIPIPLEYRMLATSFGKVNFYVTKRGKQIIDMEAIKLSINRKYDFTRDQFLSTFLHELCHLYMVQNFRDFTWRGGYHGTEWQALAKRVGDQAGVSITDGKDINDYTYNEEPKDNFVVFVKKYKGGQFGIGYTSLSIYNKNGPTIRNGIGFPIPENIIILRANEIFVKQYAKKSVKGIQFYKVNPAELVEFLKEHKNKIIDIIKFDGTEDPMKFRGASK